MMSAPLVSVVIPNYNCGRYLADCVESVLAQTYPDWEIILVDGSSTDDSVAIARSYESRHSGQFRLISLNNGPSGAARAVNTGIQAMRGTYFTVLSSDDRCLPTKFEELVHALEVHPEAGIVHAGYRIVDGQGEPVSVTIPDDLPGTISFLHLLKSNFVNAGSVLLRKELLDELGGLPEQDGETPDLWRVSQYIWWLEATLRSDLICVPKLLHDCRIQSANTDFQTSAFKASLERLGKRIFLRKYGLKGVATMISLRSGTPRIEVYRRLSSTLGFDILPEDVVLIAEAIQQEGDKEAAAISAALMEVQRSWIAGSAVEYYVAQGESAPEDALRAMSPTSPKTHANLVRLLNRAKDTYTTGNFVQAASEFRKLLTPTEPFRTLNHSVRYYLALSLEASLSHREALVEFRRLAAMDPDHRGAQQAVERLGHVVAAHSTRVSTI